MRAMLKCFLKVLVDEKLFRFIAFKVSHKTVVTFQKLRNFQTIPSPINWYLEQKMTLASKA